MDSVTANQLIDKANRVQDVLTTESLEELAGKLIHAAADMRDGWKSDPDAHSGLTYHAVLKVQLLDTLMAHTKDAYEVVEGIKNTCESRKISATTITGVSPNKYGRGKAWDIMQKAQAILDKQAAERELAAARKFIAEEENKKQNLANLGAKWKYNSPTIDLPANKSNIKIEDAEPKTHDEFYDRY